MSDVSYVVVFPSTIAKQKIPLLITNIKKILKIKNQQISSIKKDDNVIVIEANDPVFASSAISMLFGVSKVAIARKIPNQFDGIVSEITKIGGNLLLKGERFLVRVEGSSSGFLPKDVEIASTSSIIDRKSNIGARPGTDEDYEKMLYTFLTKTNAYVCIYVDEGHQGNPIDTHKSQVLCCIYDELSAVSCLEMIKQGFSVQVIVCYHKKSDLMNLVKILVRLIPFMLKESITIDFFRIDVGFKKFEFYVSNVFFLLVSVAKKKKFSHISIPINPMIFGENFMDIMIKEALKKKLTIHDSLGTLGDSLVRDAKMLGINNFETILERMTRSKLTIKSVALKDSLSSLEEVTVKIGPNNLHEILDSLEIEH